MKPMFMLLAACGCAAVVGCANLGNGKLDLPQAVIDAAKIDPRASEAIAVLQQAGLVARNVKDDGCENCVTNIAYTDLDGKPIDKPQPYRRVVTYSRASVETVQP